MSVDVIVQSGGTTGPPGPGWISGSGVPVDNVTGYDGYFYIDTATPGLYYGPRTSGVWGPAHSFAGGVQSGTTSRLTAAAQAPASPSVGDVWIDIS